MISFPFSIFRCPSGPLYQVSLYSFPYPSLFKPPHSITKITNRKEKGTTYSQNIPPPSPPNTPCALNTSLTPLITLSIPTGLPTALYASGLAPSHAGAPIYSRGFGLRVEAFRECVHETILVLKPGAPISQEGLLKNCTPGRD
jgi:hypothetical protein